MTKRLEDFKEGDKISFRKKPALLCQIDKIGKTARVIQRKSKICINVYDIILPCLCEKPQNYTTKSHHKNSSEDYKFLNSVLEVKGVK